MNIPLNCKRWPRNEETAPTPNTRARVNWGLPMHGGNAALVAWCCLNQSCCRELLATAFQDEPKCHCSLSRNSNYDVSLLLRCQVLELLVNTEKQQHRLWQCSMLLGFLLKTQNSTTLWKKFVPFFGYRISCIKWFCLPMFRPKLWHRRAKEKTENHAKRYALTLGGKST